MTSARLIQRQWGRGEVQGCVTVNVPFILTNENPAVDMTPPFVTVPGLIY